jgi:RTX calcium-binding nonapeptide repeat (4 copies)
VVVVIRFSFGEAARRADEVTSPEQHHCFFYTSAPSLRQGRHWQAGNYDCRCIAFWRIEMATYSSGITYGNEELIVGQTVEVQVGAVIRGDNTVYAALVLQGTGTQNYDVTVNGAIVAYSNTLAVDTSGLWFNSLGSSEHTLIIGITGSIFGNTGGGVYVDVNNLLTSFTNNGNVSTDDTNIAAVSAFGVGDSNWTNNGSIVSAFSSAINFAKAGTHELTNNGVITSEETGDNAIFSGDVAGIEDIINTGVINGNIFLGGGDDELNTLVGRINGEVYMGDGDDTFYGSNTDSLIFVGGATFVHDIANGGNGRDYLAGYAGNDTLNGDAGDDNINGGAGDDILNGGNHDQFGDYVSYSEASSAVNVSLAIVVAQNTGGDGIDTISGFEGIYGSAFGDTLSGATDVNIIYGNNGNDIIFGGADSVLDYFIGGTGNDTNIVRTNDEIFEDVGEGTADKVRAQTTFVLAADDNIEIMETYSPTATTVINLTGNALAQTISGNSGANILMGLGGIDKLTGGRGKDSLFGGTEKDTFDFNAVNESGLTSGTRDIIQDFVHGLDKIDLSTIDANTATSTSSFGLLAKGTATSAVGSGKIGWYQINPAGTAGDMTILRINNDADATIEMTIQLKGLINLTSVDFVL